ncbi:hypothetical protein SB781_36280, partial [Paraburkholderia sp. SIMBA_061]
IKKIIAVTKLNIQATSRNTVSNANNISVTNPAGQTNFLVVISKSNRTLNNWLRYFFNEL